MNVGLLCVAGAVRSDTLLTALRWWGRAGSLLSAAAENRGSGTGRDPSISDRARKVIQNRFQPLPTLIRDEDTITGYDLALVTTDLVTPAAALVTRCAWRWSVETTFAEARTLLGVGQARNRSENAVRRTIPFGLYCYSITVMWYASHGHHPSDAADHHARAP